LQIPDEDFGLTVTSRRPGKKDEQLTIQDLFDVAPTQKWRKFTGTGVEVYATGPFSVPVRFN
jgi:hypothetical protein